MSSLQTRLGVVLLLFTLGYGAVVPAQDGVLSLATVLLHPLGQQDTPLNWEELNRFYAAERFQPVWSGPRGPNSRAEQFREYLRRVGAEGLVPSHYHIALIEELWDSGEEADRLQLELLLSSAFFDFVRDVRDGQLEPQRVAPLWKIEKVPADAVTMLRLALLLEDFHDALDALPPAHPGYRRLRQALARYRAIEKKGEWPPIPDGALLRPGMNESRVALLRRRLALEGDLQLPPGDEAGSDYFDQALSYAVRRFQVRHGLRVDGVVGEKTLQALNVTVAERIEQIVLAMERWRWLPQYLGRRHIIVNIPALELAAFGDGEVKLSMPVIIGATERPTPMISGLLHTIVFNPDWTVPRNLALRDVVPRQRSNPDYMASRNIRVFADWNADEELEPHQVDWSKVNINYFPYMLRQAPGPENALGKVKFLFYNHHDIYLHDTPHTGLFSSHERAYSSGCIRLEEPKRLASFVLAEEKGRHWDEVMVQSLFDRGETFEVALSARIPVYLLYFTAWAGENGAVHFRPDVYGEDAMLRPCMPFEQTP